MIDDLGLPIGSIGFELRRASWRLLSMLEQNEAEIQEMLLGKQGVNEQFEAKLAKVERQRKSRLTQGE